MQGTPPLPLLPSLHQEPPAQEPCPLPKQGRVGGRPRLRLAGPHRLPEEEESPWGLPGAGPACGCWGPAGAAAASGPREGRTPSPVRQVSAWHRFIRCPLQAGPGGQGVGGRGVGGRGHQAPLRLTLSPAPGDDQLGADLSWGVAGLGVLEAAK